jgi:KipI family sensor histidine kinase inhibitor
VTASSRLVPAGDSAVIVEFEDRIDERINAQAIGLASAVESARLAGVRDVVPTYRTVAVYFDPLRTDHQALTDLLEREAGAVDGGRRSGPRADGPRDIPVCYGGDFGPDLADVAAQARLSEAQVIARHSGTLYRVFMMGFVPGFTYLGTVDPAIATPRRATPRLRVPAGSVGIAGLQTGIYPAETPGGWQLLGRTPLKLFDLARANPFLLKPGDTVRFHPITAGDYARGAAG